MKQMLKRICEKLDLSTIFLAIATMLLLGVAIYEGNNWYYCLAGMAIIGLLVCEEPGKVMCLFIIECCLAFLLNYDGVALLMGAIGTYLVIWVLD